MKRENRQQYAHTRSEGPGPWRALDPAGGLPPSPEGAGCAIPADKPWFWAAAAALGVGDETHLTVNILTFCHPNKHKPFYSTARHLDGILREKLRYVGPPQARGGAQSAESPYLNVRKPQVIFV